MWNELKTLLKILIIRAYMLTMLALLLFQFMRATFSVMKDEYAEQYSKLKDEYEASIILYIIISATNEIF